MGNKLIINKFKILKLIRFLISSDELFLNVKDA